ncbi:MAG: entericidin A/B family lipoprotein [Proteobacteria bacterium]|nr:entericidin A/B family lipoprotein [Burkholderiales bacterium]
MKSLLVAVLMATFALAGCNTVQGVGKDVERGGERLQDAADRRK